jgi:tetratricopeptide (TPR) repeat protein
MEIREKNKTTMKEKINGLFGAEHFPLFADKEKSGNGKEKQTETPQEMITDDIADEITRIKRVLQTLSGPSLRDFEKEARRCFSENDFHGFVRAIQEYESIKKERGDPEEEEKNKEAKEKMFRFRMEEAALLLGRENIIMPEDIGASVNRGDMAPFPPLEEIERAKKDDLMMVLMTDKGENGQPVTLENLTADGKKDFNVLDNNIVRLRGNQNVFFTEEKPRNRWAFIGKEFIPGTEGKDMIEQLEIAAENLKTEYKDNLPLAYENAIREFNQKKEELRSKMTEKKEEGSFFERTRFLLTGKKKAEDIMPKVNLLHEIADLSLIGLIFPKAVELAYTDAANRRRTNTPLFRGKEMLTRSRTTGKHIVSGKDPLGNPVIHEIVEDNDDQVTLTQSGEFDLIHSVMPGTVGATGITQFRVYEYSDKSFARAKDMLAAMPEYKTETDEDKAKAEALVAGYMEEQWQKRIYENYENREKEFYLQIDAYLHKKYGERSGLPDDEFIRLFAPLLKKLPELAVLDIPEEHVPFVLVIGNKIVGMEEKAKPIANPNGIDISLLHRQGSDAPAYFLTDVDVERMSSGMPLTFEETLAVLEQKKDLVAGKNIRVYGAGLLPKEAHYIKMRWQKNWNNFEVVDKDTTDATDPNFQYKHVYSTVKEPQLSVGDDGSAEIVFVEKRGDKLSEQGELLHCGGRIFPENEGLKMIQTQTKEVLEEERLSPNVIRDVAMEPTAEASFSNETWEEFCKKYGIINVSQSAENYKSYLFGRIDECEKKGNYYAAAVLCEKIGDYETAKSFYLEAAKTKDNCKDDFDVGVLYEKAGDLKKAKEMYLRDNSGPHFKPSPLALYAAAKISDTEEAKKLYEETGSEYRGMFLEGNHYDVSPTEGDKIRKALFCYEKAENYDRAEIICEEVMKYPFLSEDERESWREKGKEMQGKNIDACEKAGRFYRAVYLSKKFGDAEMTERLYAKAEEKDLAKGGISRRQNPQAMAEAWKKVCERYPKVRSEFSSPEEWWDHQKMVIEESENDGRYYLAASWSEALGEKKKARLLHIRLAEESDDFVTVADHYEDAAKTIDDKDAKKLWEKAGDVYERCGKSRIGSTLECYEKAEEWGKAANISRQIAKKDIDDPNIWIHKAEKYEKKEKEFAKRTKELAKLEKKIARAKRWKHMNFFEKTKDWITGI